MKNLSYANSSFKFGQVKLILKYKARFTAFSFGSIKASTKKIIFIQDLNLELFQLNILQIFAEFAVEFEMHIKKQ